MLVFTSLQSLYKIISSHYPIHSARLSSFYEVCTVFFAELHSLYIHARVMYVYMHMQYYFNNTLFYDC